MSQTSLSSLDNFSSHCSCWLTVSC